MNAEDLIRTLTQWGLFIGAVLLGVFVAPENPLLVVGICFGLFILIGISRLARDLWIIYPIASGFGGAINLIPGGLTLLQIASLVLAAMCLYYMKADSSFRIKIGPPWIFWPVLLINVVLIYNWIKARDIGLNIFGSSLVGGKSYLECILPFFGYVAAISMYRPGSRHDFRLPLYVLVGYFFDALIFLFSSLFLQSSIYIYKFYDVVNYEAFQTLGVSQTAAIGEGFVLRFHELGLLGYVLLAALQAYLPFYKWLNLPNFLIGPPIAFFALLAALISGYRNFLVRLIIVACIGIWQSFRIFSLFLLLPAVALVGLLIFGQGSLFNLPGVVQRTLVFLPGDWDPAIKKSADASADFRKDIRRIYFSEFFRWDNFLGEGFLYSRDDLRYSQEQFWKQVGFRPPSDEDESIREFIIRRSHHEGVANIHHITGHVGFIIWLVFSVLGLFFCGRYLLKTPLTLDNSSGHFGATLITASILTYWVLFGNLREAVSDIMVFSFCYYTCYSRPKEIRTLFHEEKTQFLKQNISSLPMSTSG